MKIVLLEDVKSLGKKGDIVETSEGYARNFILPKKLGVEATPANLNTLKLQKANEKRKADELLAAAKALEERIAKVTLVLSIKGGKDGKTYGSVGTKEIAEALARQADITVDKKKIAISEPIKSFDQYQVTVKLHKDVGAKLNLRVEEE